MFSRLRSGFKGISSTGSGFYLGNAVAWDRMFATNRDRSDPNGSKWLQWLEARRVGFMLDCSVLPRGLR